MTPRETVLHQTRTVRGRLLSSEVVVETLRGLLSSEVVVGAMRGLPSSDEGAHCFSANVINNATHKILKKRPVQR